MKDDLKKTKVQQREKQKGAQMSDKQKKSTGQSADPKPQVDNFQEEEIPEWKSSIRRETPQDDVKSEHKFSILDHKKAIAVAAAVVVLGGAAFGVAPRLMNQETKTEKQTQEEKKSEVQTDVSQVPNSGTSDSETSDSAREESRGEAKDSEEKVSTSPVNGLAHAESYEALYEILHKWQSDSADWSASDGARVTTMDIAEYDTADAVGESTADSAASGGKTTASMDNGEIDSGYTYQDTEESADHSTTNIQEENVDEADIVKTDGTYIYAMDSRGDIRIVDTASMKLVSEISGDRNSDYLELYLNGDSLQVIRQQETYITYKGTEDISASDGKEQDDKTDSSTEDGNTVRASYSVPVTTVAVDTYDISDRENPKQTGTCQQDGAYLSSRRNNNYLYLFTSYAPDTTEGADAKIKYVPRINEDYIAYDHIYLPASEETSDYIYNGKNYLVASSVSDEKPSQISDSMAVVSGAETFYVSEENIYSAVVRWDGSGTRLRTEIVRIGYEDGLFTEGNIGSVSGELNNNFSMDEYNGNLRVVTTTAGWNKDYSEYSRTNGLYILDADMKTIGKIEGLAENEEIKSARFMGDTGYFVTYRNTDPLFSVDLSDPEKPEILGELNITGFSEYLHFYGENRLLGIGWETDPDTGSISGLKCSMFDISDPSAVKEIDRIILKDVSTCDALSNYRAILASPQKNLFGFAYGLYRNSGTGDYYHTEEQYYYGLLSYSEKDGFVPGAYLNIAQSGLFDDALTGSEYRSLRGVYVSDTFYLVTENGISAYDMTDGYKLTDTLVWE